MQSSKTIRDPAREKFLATGKAVVDGWVKVAATLDAQGEIVMAGDVRYYAAHSPPVLTDRENSFNADARKCRRARLMVNGYWHRDHDGRRIDVAGNLELQFLRHCLGRCAHIQNMQD